MNMYFYDLGPIDYNWKLLPTVIEMAERNKDWDGNTEDVAALYEKVHYATNKLGCSDDEVLSEEPRVLAFPTETTFEIGFAWKTVNNGTTYIVSPYPIAQLEAQGNEHIELDIDGCDMSLERKWELFISLLPQLQDPLLLSIFAQATLIPMQRSRGALKIKLASSRKFFRDKLDNDFKWVPLLKQAFGDEYFIVSYD